MTIETRSEHACFGGRMGYYTHSSTATGTSMRFSVYMPPASERGPVPALYVLAGLSCTEETFAIKAGAQRYAAEHGLALVTCDTSPRGVSLPGDADFWDFGQGAGFYLDATEAPWSGHYRMGTYVNEELPAVIEAHFPVQTDRRGITGHSMGGHGALVTALRNPDRWHSVSAFAPISNPSVVPWGEKAFTNYLGENRQRWAEWDAALLIRRRPYPGALLVDQGDADAFLENQLRPHLLADAAAAAGQTLMLRRHPGYDHSYWFIQSVVADHIAFHAKLLGGA
ncbi:MAG: S-formylglutathione hydrolase [Myxococcales bacterium]|nr:S-formylglutathione hydrolase [Myxococcales bacterium]